eukprot:TRINITY_DN54477_c0_g1_i1.p2 TRINITY_DN54477_c0_g1~~TRINITY_DN54477_c0_g1_i1.p2  ORF type:complete len:178 (-),score=27.70 TRINITY_DN54477_c0_g1_i1:137-670(-)
MAYNAFDSESGAEVREPESLPAQEPGRRSWPAYAVVALTALALLAFVSSSASGKPSNPVSYRVAPPRELGVEVEQIAPGDGVHFPKKGDTVTMHYTGTLAANGKVFDSDRGRGFSTAIGVGRVIRGWDEGVPQMSLGEKAILHISSDYAYGARGAGGVIPPNADLDFEVELVNVAPR